MACYFKPTRTQDSTRANGICKKPMYATSVLHEPPLTAIWIPNQYDIRILQEGNGILDESIKVTRTIVIKDNTTDVKAGSKRKRSVTELLNPKFIGMHGAMILHMRGAGDFFERCGENGVGTEFLRSWAEVEGGIMLHTLATNLRETLG